MKREKKRAGVKERKRERDKDRLIDSWIDRLSVCVRERE